MTPTRAAFFCCKACDIVAEDALSVAIQHSIGLIDIKWGTFMSPRRRYRYVTWYVRETQTYSSENSREGKCKVYTRKTIYLESKLKAVPLEARSEEHLKHPDRWPLVEQHLFVHHGDDPSWIQYEALFLLSMKSQDQTFYYSYLLQMHHISIGTCFCDKSPLVRIPIASAGCNFSPNQFRLNILPRLFEQNFLSSKRFARIGNFARRQFFPTNCKKAYFGVQTEKKANGSPRYNFLEAVGRTQLEGSCKVYAGKTNWKTNWKLYPCKQELRSTWSTRTDDP